MYLDFYQLKKAPFHITPDPDFLFLSPSHKAALGSIIYGIEERQGFVAIIGEVGLGKTTILRSYLERIDQHQLKTLYVFNANISFRSLLKTIFREFSIDFESDDLFEMVNRLHQVLIEEYKRGRNVALIIDEAQNMPIETLENLRMLSNLETATEKLVQIVLIGQPEFDNTLNLNELRQLKQRVVIRSTIAPLTDEESLAYIEHRLAKVAMTQEPLFTRGALKLITQQAKGTPRVLNILCTNALIAGFGYRQKPIPVGTVKEVIGEAAGARKRPRFLPGLSWAAGLVMCAAMLWISPYRDMIFPKRERTGASIAPLTDEESLAYIEHRLAKVAMTQEPLFTRGALKLITQQAKGTPRVLNILCTNALIAGFGYRQKPIPVGTVKEVIGEAAGARKRPRFLPGLSWAAGLVTCAAMLWVSPYRDMIFPKRERTGASFAPTIQHPAGTGNHTMAPPVTPPQETTLPRRGVLEAVSPQDHLRSYVSQSIASDVKQNTPPRLEVEAKHNAEHIDSQGVEKRLAPAFNTPQAHGQEAQEQPNAIQKVALPLVRIMSKGDYISKIALEVYGYANEEILALIKKHNPQIKDINRVEVGEKVLFPDSRAALR